MNKFTLIQKIRNKIKVKGSLFLSISTKAKLVNCNISIQGKNNKLVIEEGSVIRKANIEILGDNCSIIIGKNCIVGHGCYLSAKEGRVLQIGDECMLSRNAKLMTSDGHYIYLNNEIINYGKDIIIQNSVWIADNVTVLKGVVIGEKSVIGINSTVTKDIPQRCIVAGNPAKIIKEGIDDWEK